MSTFDRVKKVVVEQLDANEDEVTPAASFVDDLGADSLDVWSWSWDWKRSSMSRFRTKMQRRSQPSRMPLPT